MLAFVFALLATTPRPAEIAAARQLAREGFKLADGGNCAAAVEPLSRAESLFHAPTILVRLAECHLAQGRLVLGTEELRRVTVEDLGPTPSRAFVAAKSRARVLLASAEPRLAHLTVRVTGPTVPIVTLDGEPLAAGMLGLEIPVDPGPHLVKAEADGFIAAEKPLTVAEGGSDQVELELSPSLVAASEPTAVVTPSPAPAAVARVTTPVPSTQPLRAPALISLAVGVAGFGVGIGFGVAALNDKTKLDNVCVNKACPISARNDLALLQRDATLSTIGWAVGGVAAATSLVLLVLLSTNGAGDRVAWLVPTQGGFLVRW
jgi:hypothetical protein